MAVCTFANCPAPEPGPQGRCEGCGTLLQSERIRQRYTVMEVTSRSKFSLTYLVTDEKVQEQRVIKELQPVSQDDPDFYSPNRTTAERLFERESRVLMTLQHRGIPRLYATFEE